MKYAKTVLTLSLMPLLSSGAEAASAISVKNLPDGEQVSLTGTVEEFDSQRALMLRDSTGAVKVDLRSAKPVVLKNGEPITVTGQVNQTILGTDVVAHNISEDKGLGQQVGEAIDSVTGQDAASGATLTTIQAMPKSGLIKVNGTVDSVSSGKKFTLKDSTGHIDVQIKSDESASLTKGTAVTVIGYVNKGLLSKNINATQVDVRSP